MIGDPSRMPAAFAAALVLHAALFALVAARGPARLALVPPPMLLTFIEPARREAGPGERSQQLRSAQPAPVPPAQQPPRQAVAPREKAPEALPVPAKRPKTPPPQQAAAQSRKPADASAPVTAPPAIASGGTGEGSINSAPQWAPSARVRYEALLYAWIDRHKKYPLLAQRRGLEGSGSVRVRIDRYGRVLDRSLERSTGEALLDEAALDMVRRADPFPEVPADYGGSSFEFVAPVEYRLR